MFHALLQAVRIRAAQAPGCSTKPTLSSFCLTCRVHGPSRLHLQLRQMKFLVSLVLSWCGCTSARIDSRRLTVWTKISSMNRDSTGIPAACMHAKDPSAATANFLIGRWAFSLPKRRMNHSVKQSVDPTHCSSPNLNPAPPLIASVVVV